MDRRSQSRCPALGNARHWFTEHGGTGNYTTHCVRCGAPNPKPKPGAINNAPDGRVIRRK